MDQGADRVRGNAANLDWKARYEVGHRRIDLEHRAFLDIIQTVDAEVRGNGDRNRILRLLNELRAYAHFHFISEENIMADYAYPDRFHHAELHRHLLEQLHICVLGFEVGQEPAEDLLDFLVDWFVNHTTTEDVKIARFMRSL